MPEMNNCSQPYTEYADTTGRESKGKKEVPKDEEARSYEKS